MNFNQALMIISSFGMALCYLTGIFLNEMGEQPYIQHILFFMGTAFLIILGFSISVTMRGESDPELEELDRKWEEWKNKL